MRKEEKGEAGAKMLPFVNQQLPRSDKMCPSCGEHEAVFFQSQQRSAETGMVRLTVQVVEPCMSC